MPAVGPGREEEAASRATAPAAPRATVPPASRAAGWAPWLLATAFVVVGVWLRACQLPGQIVVDDEWHALHKILSSDVDGIRRSFGWADYSIPLTLWYRFVALHGGLSELAMRLPSFVASCALLVVLPLLLPKVRDRRGLAANDDRAESVPLARRDAEQTSIATGNGIANGNGIATGNGIAATLGLLAISPLLVHFAKLARPYALVALLGPVALIAFHRWWCAAPGGPTSAPGERSSASGERTSAPSRAGWAALYVASAFLCAFLHPVTLPFVVAPFAWFGAVALVAAARGDRRRLARLAAIGVPLALLLAAGLGPPLVHDWEVLRAKSGTHSATLESVYRSMLMLAGTTSRAVLAALSIAVASGALVLARRDARFVGYLLFCCVAFAATVIASRATYIHHPLVLARYLLPTLPLLCWLAGEGIAALLYAVSARGSGSDAKTEAGREAGAGAQPASGAEGWSGVSTLVACAIVAAGVAALAITGPLPGFLFRPNQFIGHLKYQFDYDPTHNPYVYRARVQVPAFYRELAARPPMSTTIVEMPWRLESHYDPLPWYQEVHRQWVRIGMVGGVCGSRTWGELPWGDRRFAFRNVVHLRTILDGGDAKAEFLVVHRQPWAVDAGAIVEWPDMQACLATIEEKLGKPVSDDGDVVVFRLGGGGNQPPRSLSLAAPTGGAGLPWGGPAGGLVVSERGRGRRVE